MEKFQQTQLGRIHYREWGEGQPLVLLHGNGGSSHEFAENARTLEKEFRVFAWDMPGQGDSSPLQGHMTIGGYSDILAQWLTAIGVEKAIVGGSSVGAVIAADFAARYSDRVRAALLIELASRPEQWWADHWAMVESMFSSPTQDAKAIAKRFVSPVDAGVIERWNTDRNKAGGKTMMDVMWAGREYGLEATLRRIAVPTILIFGDKSPVLERAAELRDLVPNAALEILPNAGHFPMFDARDGFDRAVAQFARSQW